ncbi:fasciclin domain-containing protein [Blastomonas sp.]|uniref:fasciclin domain-containing protein n=1 Tax=Blastomonas sp. TaxID=1909299 RepID=UPI0035945B35
MRSTSKLAAMTALATLAFAGVLTGCGSQDGGGDPVTRSSADRAGAADEEEAEEPESVLRVDEVVMRTPALATLSRAIRGSGLTAGLAGEEPLTLFAPEDMAFNKLGVDSLADLLLPENKERLAVILNYHIIPGRLSAEDLRKRITSTGGSIKLESLQGEALTVSVELDQLRISDATGNAASIITTDLPASNGIVHGIDTVLGPRE